MKYDKVQKGQVVAVDRGRNKPREKATVADKFKIDDNNHRVVVVFEDQTVETLKSCQKVSLWDNWQLYLNGCQTAGEREKQIHQLSRERYRAKLDAERREWENDRTAQSQHEIDEVCTLLDNMGFEGYTKPDPLGTSSFGEGPDGVFMFTPEKLRNLLTLADHAGPPRDPSLPYGTEFDWGEDL